MELQTIIEFAAPVLVGGFWLLVILVVVFRMASKDPRAARFIEYVANTDNPDELTNSKHLFA
jgi:hypothetical protein